MAELAIKGHPTRGEKVIQLLEMLGGNNLNNLNGASNMYYFMGLIVSKILAVGKLELDKSHEQFTYFTLEEFEEKYPFKVGDKVKAWVNGCRGVFNIQDITWDSIAKEVKYRIHGYWHSVENLQPYKEETMEESTNKAIFEGNTQSCDIMNDIIKEETMKDKGALVEIDLTRELCIADEVEVILGDYEFVLKDGKTYFVKKKPQYPKTYEECCKILGIEDRENGYCGYEYELLGEFQQLLICRDAYWKIAGEQMGLDKPWKPDWNNVSDKHCIYFVSGEIWLTECQTRQCTLAFPTEEMRDAFYDNFKDLINKVKELL